MTEADWLASTDPAPMLDELRGRISDRKLILFAAACCRHIWDLMTDEPCRTAVQMAERFADRKADLKELSAARTPTIPAAGPAARAAYWTAHAKPTQTVWHVHTAAAEAETNAATRAVTSGHEAAWNAASAAAMKAQADLLREIVGNPFRPVDVDPAWLSWGSRTVGRIAQEIYDESRFAEMPILADALEDAGCANARLLSHLRADEKHVRGCWVLDLLLERS
jgi:predicted HAD superfamily Cof-like phosphohydrolase